MNFRSNAVFTQNQNFINLRLASVNTTDKFWYGSIPTTRVVMPISSSDWIWHGHDIEASRDYSVSKTRANSDYILKSYFETMREIQDFERENNPLPLTRPTEFPEQNGKAHVPDDPDSDPSLSEFSSNKKKRVKKKKRRKYRKYDLSDPSSSDDYDSSKNSDYRHKRRKEKSDRKNDPINWWESLTTKLLMTPHKSNITGFKTNEDPLQCRIDYLKFVDSTEMLFS